MYATNRLGDVMWDGLLYAATQNAIGMEMTGEPLSDVHFVDNMESFAEMLNDGHGYNYLVGFGGVDGAYSGQIFTGASSFTERKCLDMYRWLVNSWLKDQKQNMYADDYMVHVLGHKNAVMWLAKTYGSMNYSAPGHATCQDLLNLLTDMRANGYRD